MSSTHAGAKRILRGHVVSFDQTRELVLREAPQRRSLEAARREQLFCGEHQLAPGLFSLLVAGGHVRLDPSRSYERVR